MKTTGFLTLDADLLREVRSVAVDEGRSISTFTRCARPTGVWRPAKGTSLRNLLGAGFGFTTVHEHRAERHDVPAGFLTSRARISRCSIRGSTARVMQVSTQRSAGEIRSRRLPNERSSGLRESMGLAPQAERGARRAVLAGRRNTVKDAATRAAAVVGFLFSAISVVAGLRVLTGVDRPDYVVLSWLVVYNVAAGSVGVVVGPGLWKPWGWAAQFARALASAHGAVFAVLVARRVAGAAVANTSIMAMLLRTAVWVAIAVVSRRALISKARDAHPD